MNIDLKKADLLCLVLGVTPKLDIISKSPIADCGSYNGSYDEWEWDASALNYFSEEELWNIYTLCKQSWEK